MGESGNQAGGTGAPALPLRNDDLMSELDMANVLFKELKEAKIKAEKLAREWEEKYNRREKELEDIISEKWGLEYEAKDKARDIEMLESQLQNSIPLEDWRDPPPKLRTALELGQQERIEALQDENKRLWKEISQLKANKNGQQPVGENKAD
ncbi:hypothetical protein F5Y10DRAFT_243262 [Nemania abortiva]|nr:hypothetical protein F5Y10DRAFT_243262 [Nemania abortiva]